VTAVIQGCPALVELDVLRCERISKGVTRAGEAFCRSSLSHDEQGEGRWIEAVSAGISEDQVPRPDEVEDGEDGSNQEDEGMEEAEEGDANK
jgi:hypothetical protein